MRCESERLVLAIYTDPLLHGFCRSLRRLSPNTKDSRLQDDYGTITPVYWFCFSGRLIFLNDSTEHIDKQRSARIIPFSFIHNHANKYH